MPIMASAAYVSPSVVAVTLSDPAPPLPAVPSTSDLTALSTLPPGIPHTLSPTALPTAQSILSGAYMHTSPRAVVVVPRRPEHSGCPSLPMVYFSVHGRAGLRLSDLLNVGDPESDLKLDGARDKVWGERGWKKTRFTVDWPGVTSTSQIVPCNASNGKPYMRTQVAEMVARRLVKFFDAKKSNWGPQFIDANTRPWDLTHTDWHSVRVLGISYYRRTWVPVLAVDV